MRHSYAGCWTIEANQNGITATPGAGIHLLAFDRLFWRPYISSIEGMTVAHTSLYTIFHLA